MQMSPNKSHVGTHRLLLGSTFNEDHSELVSQLGNEQEPSHHLHSAQVGLECLLIVL